MQPIDESVLFIAIRQCLETADHHIRHGNRRDAEFYLNRADVYANRLIFCRQIDATSSSAANPPAAVR